MPDVMQLGVLVFLSGKLKVDVREEGSTDLVTRQEVLP